MPVVPYKRTPEPPELALLLPDGQVVHETGEPLRLDALPDGVCVWAGYETVHRLVREGKGEALCWNGEEIRWRHRRFEDEWVRRRSDVAVLRTPLPLRPETALQGLVAWRDWLARYGASCGSPQGAKTTGSAAWSLLRARLTRPLFTGWGSPPPLKWTLGGRQTLGLQGRGEFSGRFELWDLPAAYARELGELVYGGHWLHGRDLPARPLDGAFWARQGRPVFGRVTVKTGEAPFGPLPRRPRRPLHWQESLLLTEYPRGKTMKGVWAWDELAAAEAQGASIVKVHELWVHLSVQQPFLPWWRAVEDGRRIRGLGGTLAKMTGNALWGQFCMDGARGTRTIHGRLSDRRRKTTRRLVPRPLARKGGRPAAHDLAETVSGRTRARLALLLNAEPERVLSAHTDGAWLVAGASVPDAWRVKVQAKRIELLGPQTLRYWPRRGAPVAIVSGVPAEIADREFDAWWAQLVDEGELAA